MTEYYGVVGLAEDELADHQQSSIVQCGKSMTEAIKGTYSTASTRMSQQTRGSRKSWMIRIIAVPHCLADQVLGCHWRFGNGLFELMVCSMFIIRSALLLLLWGHVAAGSRVSRASLEGRGGWFCCETQS
jgi:hypothetical protein